MAADIVPIGLGLDERDVFTLWAPRYRDAGDEWEAFLGKDEDLYVFESVPDLVAFVRTDTDNDLVDHPNWGQLTTAGAVALAECPALAELRELNLRLNDIDADGLRALARSPHLNRLSDLQLWHNPGTSNPTVRKELRKRFGKAVSY